MASEEEVHQSWAWNGEWPSWANIALFVGAGLLSGDIVGAGWRFGLTAGITYGLFFYVVYRVLHT